MAPPKAGDAAGPDEPLPGSSRAACEPEQLSLDLGRATTYDASEFLAASSNARALAWLRRWPDWPSTALVVHGPPGSGKTHLARSFAARTAGHLLEADRIECALDVARWPERPVHVVEHADRIAVETSLLHLYNASRERGGHLLLTSRWPLAAWPFRLPDLRSRLATAPVIAIEPPDDALLGGLLVKLFHDRQLRVEENVVRYLLTRMERSFAEAHRVVEALDRAAMRRQRPIGLVLVREVLEAGRPESSDDPPE